jgi:predicted Zn-dependent protease
LIVRASRFLAVCSLLVCLPALRARVADAQTQPAAQKAFTEGQALNTAKKPADAAERFLVVTAIEPSFAPGWYALAAAYRRAGQCERAIPAYRRYAEMQPGETEPYYGLGLCLKETGDRRGASEALAKYVAMEKRPESQKWIDHARTVLGELSPAGGGGPGPATGDLPRRAAPGGRRRPRPRDR